MDSERVKERSEASEERLRTRGRLESWTRPVLAISGVAFALLAAWLHIEVHHLILTAFIALLGAGFLLVAAFASDRVVEAVSDFFGSFF